MRDKQQGKNQARALPPPPSYIYIFKPPSGVREGETLRQSQGQRIIIENANEKCLKKFGPHTHTHTPERGRGRDDPRARPDPSPPQATLITEGLKINSLRLRFISFYFFFPLF